MNKRETVTNSSTSDSSFQIKEPSKSLGLTKAIYLTNLIPGMTRHDVDRICKKYGHIEKIRKTSTQSPSAIVVFHTTEQAKLAAEVLHGQMLSLYSIEGSRETKTNTRLKVQYAPLTA